MFKKIITTVLSATLLISLISINVFAEENHNIKNLNNEEQTENPQDSNDEEVWEIYDSNGRLITETNDPDSFMINNIYSLNRNAPHQKRNILRKLLSFITANIGYQIIAFVSTVHYAYNYTVTTVSWLNEHLKFNSLSDGEYKIKVYSTDGNVENPYPPHSQQGATWKSTNFYYAIEK